MADIVLITGLSGAGRSGAADVLDDLGYYVIDNLPTSLLPTIVELASQPGGIERLALVSGRNHDDVLPEVAHIRAEGHEVTLVFLDASTPVLVQRYDATRRRHPFADHADGLLEAIEHERELLQKVKVEADLVIDTTDLNVHQLKERLVGAFEMASSQQLQIAVESFGYKNGLPLDADIVMDVRFLPNPHWDDDLRPLTGHDPRVRDYVIERAQAATFLDGFEALLVELLPSYRAEGRSYLTIAIGCTGGRHRSVAVAEELAGRFTEHGVVARTSHRDVGGG
ncbi:MAG: RNase adapter RapZ [Ilumatobacter sp.]|uniref:RNase adapter RapZ n=1 Tax=Ilumatobacter sp. TaxID=1967498 RepID=UPI0026054B37|nr:RNase adapter RapZ [Ilumatobacter sp.]MDJ0771045.1 RNase adapter RapZ [Ilumatobacter sp.]